jgi:hypothetical protein
MGYHVHENRFLVFFSLFDFKPATQSPDALANTQSAWGFLAFSAGLLA